jgi:general stress protein YciG
MSRGGEAFGRRPPPPPLIHGPPHFSTQPPRAFPTASPKDRIKPPIPPIPSRNDGIGGGSGEKIFEGLNNNNSPLVNRSATRNAAEEGKYQDPSGQQPGSSNKPSDKDVFSKAGASGGESSSSGAESDAHPLLGITPAAPGEAFDFNPILSNPAVTRILAGSSGRIPQWEPTLPDLHGNSLMNMLCTHHHSCDYMRTLNEKESSA